MIILNAYDATVIYSHGSNSNKLEFEVVAVNQYSALKTAEKYFKKTWSFAKIESIEVEKRGNDLIFDLDCNY